MKQCIIVIKEIFDAFILFFSNLLFVIKLYFKKRPPPVLDYNKPKKAKFAILDNEIYEKSY